jgi:hypothetical protein
MSENFRDFLLTTRATRRSVIGGKLCLFALPFLDLAWLAIFLGLAEKVLERRKKFSLRNEGKLLENHGSAQQPGTRSNKLPGAQIIFTHIKASRSSPIQRVHTRDINLNPAP